MSIVVLVLLWWCCVWSFHRCKVGGSLPGAVVSVSWEMIFYVSKTKVFFYQSINFTNSTYKKKEPFYVSLSDLNALLHHPFPFSTSPVFESSACSHKTFV